MKQLFLTGIIILLFLFPLRSLSQTTISYRYDNAGNLTEKVICLRATPKSSFVSANPKNPSPPADSTSQKKSISDDSFVNREVKIFPNPTTGVIKIEMPDSPDGDSPFRFTVMDINGRFIIDRPGEPSGITLDLSARPDGIYFLHIQSGNVVSKWKIIKQ